MSALVFVLLALLATLSWAQEFPDCENGPLTENGVCNTSLPITTRVQALIDAMTLGEKLRITHNNSPGVPRLGLPSYNWWGEALHGVAGAPGVNFSDSGNFSYATSFPQPILTAASFDKDLFASIGTIISTEARAFSNANRSGLDFWTPNINPFRDPRWGRGQETPGEDTFLVKAYIDAMVPILQGGPDPTIYKIIATCKHYSGYDIETWEGNSRYGYYAIINQQDYSEYYMQPFQQCARDTKVASIMCAYNSVNGVPACADKYTIQTILRGHWNWTADENYITSDCTSIQNMYSDHHAFPTRQDAVSAALHAGVDVDCGYYYPTFLPSAEALGLFEESLLDRSIHRLYSGLTKLGYFDPPSSTPYRSLSWEDVSIPDAQALALQAAEEGTVLLKNDGTLPLSFPDDRNFTILLIGGWANATEEMQGNYAGSAPYLPSPWMALQNYSNLNVIVPEWYRSPLQWAVETDADVLLVVTASGESYGEGTDRNTVAWDGLTVDPLEMLATTGKPVIFAHMGEQCDDSVLLSNPNISAIIWGGYPGQSGGDALINILTGKTAPAGRLPITQYPAEYAKMVPMTDMALRPNATTGNPGRTYKWYDNATLEFGFGLHYTNFSTSLITPETTTFRIQDIINTCRQGSYNHIDLCPSTPSSESSSSLQVNVTNTGSTTTSDFVTLAFVSGEYGPQPYPIKSLVAFDRVFDLPPGASQIVSLNVTLGGLARYNEEGDDILYPGQYRILIDVPTQTTWEFSLTGPPVVLDEWPQA